MKPNYRVDAYDRITARLRAQLVPVTSMRYCAECGSDWNAKQFVSCPVCACRAAKADRQ